MKTTFIGEVSFWMHIPIFVFWIGTFFVSSTWWPDVFFWHFWFVFGLYVTGYGTGLLYYPHIKKLLFICPLTVLTQRLRGYKWLEREAWGHSFIDEIFGFFGFHGFEGNSSSFDAGSLFTHATLVVVTLQYVFGILVW